MCPDCGFAPLRNRSMVVNDEIINYEECPVCDWSSYEEEEKK